MWGVGRFRLERPAMTASAPPSIPARPPRPLHPLLAHGLVAAVAAMAWAMLLAAML